MPASVVSLDPNINTNSDDKTSLEVVEAIKRAITPIEPAKDIVIVQTETGFIPDSINLQKGQVYQIHIVNLNHKEKNVSFLMDSFSQSHNTVYGNMKAFRINPKIEGVFSYQSPETGATGTVVVVADKVRRLASDSTEKTK
ncbi:MAG: cupredoxin domain-containing protein [Moraxellaceae bacterium]|nr:cupredoxin domain-containing protein [Pseudobdellovibrionaceae bacterium]